MKSIKHLISLTVFLSMVPLGQAFGVGGADVLLNNVMPDTPETKNANANKPAQMVYEGFKLEDPLAIQLFTDWRNAGKLSYDVNSWFLMTLQGKYEKAAHLISVIQKQVPSGLDLQFNAAKIYLYHKVGLRQIFINSFIDYIDDQTTQDKAISLALWHYVDQHATNLLETSSVVLTSSQHDVVNKYIDRKTPFITNLKALTHLRKGEKALQTLIDLPSGHPARIPLAKTVILDLARQSRLGEAGKLLKKYVEPEIIKKNDPITLGDYYINLARLLYQAGALDAAISFYLKVPDKHPSFVQARAELMWSYLRTGQIAKLRGQVASLKTDLFGKYFIPEIYVVRSISNLKLCNYEEVENDFKNFISSNKKWAKIIKENLSSEDPAWSDSIDYYVSFTQTNINELENEKKLLEGLGERSIKAALPAVGIQPHWEKSAKEVTRILEQTKKKRLTEIKRLWKNRELILAEAIKKMKFVKIEAMTQIQDIAYNKREIGAGTVATKALSTKETKDKLVFPYDGVFWPDEVLNLRSQAKSFCLKKASL